MGESSASEKDKNWGDVHAVTPSADAGVSTLTKLAHLQQLRTVTEEGR
jgi:hypothetical protein